MSRSSRRFAVVVNPRAGRAAGLWPRLERELQARGIAYQVLHAASGADALRLLERQPAEVGVMTLGGDGTVAPLLPDIVARGRPLLSIAGGTGNDFSAMLGRKAGDIAAALDHCDAEPVRVDALRLRYGTTGDGMKDYGAEAQVVGERLMLNGSGMGFDAQLTNNLPRVHARWSGLARYLAAALISLREMQTTPLEVRLDGREMYSGPAILCAVMNGRSVGGGLQFSPPAQVADGLLDVVLAGDIRRAGVPLLVGKVMARRHLSHPQVHRFTGQCASLSWKTPVYLHIDGDVMGRYHWLRAEVVPQAVPLLGTLPAACLSHST